MTRHSPQYGNTKMGRPAVNQSQEPYPFFICFSVYWRKKRGRGPDQTKWEHAIQSTEGYFDPSQRELKVELPTG